MTVRGKFAVTVFVMQPAGLLAILVLRAPFGPSALLAALWFGFCVGQLRQLRCPRCGSRVYNWDTINPFSAKLYKCYNYALLLTYCSVCGQRLDEQPNTERTEPGARE